MLSYDCPFSDAPGMIRFMRGTITTRNKDWWFVAEGWPGTGKSTTKDQIIKRIDPRQSRDDAIFTMKHLMDVLEDARKNQVYNVDEGINIFHNQDWATWEAKAVSKLIRMMRIMNSLWGIAATDFEGLHPYLRDYRVRQRHYHRPVFDPDGMGNGPPQTLWKNEWFDFKLQRVTTRWIDLEFDLEIEPMDDDPITKAYERRKEDLFHELVSELRHRFGVEQAQEKKREARLLKPGKKKAN